LINKIGKYLTELNFQELFVGELGWDNPPDQRKQIIKIEDQDDFEIFPVAYKRGIYIYVCKSIPSKYLMDSIDYEISKKSLERLVIYANETQQIWRWPEPRKSGGIHYVNHLYQKNSNNTDLIQRISSIKFEISEENKLSLLSVRERVRNSFSAEEVTNRFYQEFQENHESLVNSIKGINIDEFTKWYASLLLNRLMFIYFLQKKGFLNDDLDYLRTSLNRVRSIKGINKFYEFYRDFLMELFHNGLGSDINEIKDLEIAKILGDIPYINGGIFSKHILEENFQIEIPDNVFEKIFDFFDNYKWHLDTRTSAEEGTINPDILGYIFEKYVNQKEEGAFYTKEDVTGFMTSNAILPVVIEAFKKIYSFDFSLIQKNPTRYIFEGMRFGCEFSLPPEIESEITSSTGILDDLASVNFGLPGERWREVLERRNKVDLIKNRLRTNSNLTIDFLLENNLDILTFVIDNLDNINDLKKLNQLWDRLTKIRIIDPTCGSGAFLFAALHLLSSIYSKLLELLNLNGELSEGNNGKDNLIQKQLASHPNQEYFLWKTIVLENLYGVDLMEEATEIARLRLFLALASKLERKEEIEPLPDLDMNIKVGNILVGSSSLKDAELKFANDMLMAPRFEALKESALDLKITYDQFVQFQKNVVSQSELEKIKKRHTKSTEETKNAFDVIYAESYGIYSEAELNLWKKTHVPFHWFIEFPEAMSEGGFDVVIGNPPYIAKRKVEGYAYSGFATDNCPDIYAPCMERAASLLNDSGSFSMIVPISFQFSEDFSDAREILSKYLPTKWISTYSRNPSSLFDASVGVRSTIFIGRKSTPRLLVTGLRRWYSDFRPYLFETTDYSKVELNSGSQPWPRIASENLEKLLNILNSNKMELRHSFRRSNYKVGFKTIALYYISSFLEAPPTWSLSGELIEHTSVSELSFDTEELQRIAFGITSGRIAGWWWGAFGDDFHVTGGLLYSIPFDPRKVQKNKKKIIDLTKKLVIEQKKQPLVTKYKGKLMGNYDMSRCRKITDEIDKLILDEFDLLEYWPDILFADQTLAKVTGERPGTLRRWPFPLK